MGSLIQEYSFKINIKQKMLQFQLDGGKIHNAASGCFCGEEAWNSGNSLHELYISFRVGNLDCK